MALLRRPQVLRVKMVVMALKFLLIQVLLHRLSRQEATVNSPHPGLMLTMDRDRKWEATLVMISSRNHIRIMVLLSLSKDAKCIETLCKLFLDCKSHQQKHSFIAPRGHIETCRTLIIPSYPIPINLDSAPMMAPIDLFQSCFSELFEIDFLWPSEMPMCYMSALEFVRTEICFG